ncbi:MAG: formylglycine-generating enzyme family protein [Bradymonadia bacterium]
MACLWSCGGDDLPEIADVGIRDSFVSFDSNVGRGRCVRAPETCNRRDDDCDGQTDEAEDVRVQVFSDPQHCGACFQPCTGANAQFICQVGSCVISSCDPGFIDYNGDSSDGCEADCVITAGGQELCDALDNDCDGQIDETFDLETDVNNCGTCGNACPQVDNGQATCQDGVCAIGECERNWHDQNQALDDGCEYSCTQRIGAEATEFCNGLDDDCDGFVDESMGMQQAPVECGIEGACRFDCVSDRGCEDDERCSDNRICVPESPVNASCDTDDDCQVIHRGLACIETTAPIPGGFETTRRCVERVDEPVCDGSRGFRCVYSPDYQRGNEGGRCDGIDNDCDGRTDEDFVDALFLADRRTPRPCSTGLGVCRRTGVILCSPSGERTECSALAGEPEAAIDDTCNGRDEDCDGEIDEDYVDITVNIGDSEIFAFEASRPGATALEVGINENAGGDVISYVEARACSKRDVLPWDDVTWNEASDACSRSNARLCTGEEFARACSGPQGDRFPYGNGFRSLLCNGQSNDIDPAQPGNQSASLPSGAMPRCERDGAYDLSGNLKEWVSDRLGNLRSVRGGSYATVLEGGLTCQQDGDWKDRNFHHRSIGFRCCRDILD